MKDAQAPSCLRVAQTRGASECPLTSVGQQFHDREKVTKSLVPVVTDDCDHRPNHGRGRLNVDHPMGPPHRGEMTQSGLVLVTTTR